MTLRTCFLFVAVASAAFCADSLKEAAAKRGIRIGAAVQSGYIANEPAYTATLTREYSMLEPEYEMLWSTVHQSETKYTYTGADAIVAFDASHQMPVRADHLVWHKSLPSWVTNVKDAAALNGILHDHIANVAGHFAGKVYSWEVVNEAVDDSGTKLRDSIWNNQPGIGLSGIAWIEQAFRWAHEADPKALLFYNDYSAEDSNTKSDFIYNMVKQMLADNVPIHGVGLQMHLTNNTNYPTAAGLEANIKRLTDLGLQVMITEMDVRLPVNSSGNADVTTLAKQAQLYGRVVSTCIKFPLCTGVQTWGISDKHSWIPSTFPGFGAALPFDTNYQPKDAYSSMLSALVNTPATISATNIVNGANYAGGSVAPGEIITLFGARFGPADLATLQYDAAGRILTSLAGTQLLFDGIPAPVIYAGWNQSSFIVPYGVAGKPSTTIEYVYQRASSNSVTLPVAATIPALFSIDQTGSGPGAIQDFNYALNSATNPARAGDIVMLYGTGAGVLTPAQNDGALVAPPLPSPAAAVSVTIGGIEATVLYKGGAPGLTNALLQINVQIPAGLSPGPQPVIVKVGNASSPGTVTIAVQ